ncbi:MAG: ribonuclease Z [archaeon]
MAIKITFLGTGGSTPTKQRGLTGVALNFAGENFLFDCPEGNQRQMMAAGVSYLKVHAVFFSHYHGDHVLGFPGLIATMNIHEREEPLKVFGPHGISEFVENALRIAGIQEKFEIIPIEVRSGKILEERAFFVSAFPLRHNVPCYGYSFVEKGNLGKFNKEKALKLGIPEGPLFRQLQEGKTVKWKEKTFRPEQVLEKNLARKDKKVSFVVDTMASPSYLEAIADSDILIHESSFLEEMAERARETQHCTAMQAAEIAKKSGAKALYLVHFSPRHKQSEKFELEARRVFGNVVAAKDLMEVEL